MKIRVEVHGHQQYFDYVGEPLAWLQTIENDGKGNISQVPAVVLKMTERVEIIKLETRLTYSKITVLEP